MLAVAEDLIGCSLVRDFGNGNIHRYQITELEAYHREEDLACHASKGRTKRTEIMYGDGGKVYMYLIYGMYWMLNIVTDKANSPQAILIRGIKGFSGPGRVAKVLQLDKSFFGHDLCEGSKLWIENKKENVVYNTTPRININYAPEPWLSIPYRYIMR